MRLGGASVAFTRAGAGKERYRGNFGLHVGDDPGDVGRRRALLADEIARPVAWMDQTHSIRVVVLGPGDEVGQGPTNGDGLIVDARGWPDAPAPAVMVADCLPVLLSDEAGEVIAAVHAGRAGLAGGILTAAVTAMYALLGPAVALRAAIGPAICGGCYEVPAGLRENVARSHPATWATTTWGTPSLDLAAGAEEELRGLGVVDVWRSPECTRETPTLHSYRREGTCGRQVGVIVPRRN